MARMLYIKKHLNHATKRDLVILIIIGLFIFWSQIGSTNEEINNKQTEIESAQSNGEALTGNLVKVTKVIDGDTIEIETGEQIRYIGIDTPETSHYPADCYASEATEKNREWVEGKTVRIIKDVRDQDRYGRLLRYVYVESDFINLELVKQGYARAFSVPPDTAQAEELLKAEQTARNKRLGLWGNCADKLLNLWEQTTAERAETAEYQAVSDMEILEDAPACFCDYNFYDCRDFNTQLDAQNLYDCCQEKTGQDTHLIDADANGLACEKFK